LTVKDNLKFFFERHAPQDCIQRFATDNTVFFIVAAAVGAGEKVLNASIRFRQMRFAKEAILALDKHEALKEFR
jgi:hypothetical protein